MSDQQVIAEFSDYPGLRDALREARERRNVSFEVLDEIAGSAKGFWSKILAPNGSRRVTMESLALGLGALGLKCLVVEDEEALRRVQKRFQPRNRALVRNGQKRAMAR